MKNADEHVLSALQSFAKAVKQKSRPGSGEPEEQLRSPFETLMKETGNASSINVLCIGETLLPDRIGKPDYAVQANKALVGYVELKAPGSGANPSKFKGHDKAQWNRFKALPNLLYSDGNEWGLYRSGERISIVKMDGDVTEGGSKAVTAEDSKNLLRLLTDFFQWQPIVPKNAEALAACLAPLCRMLREAVAESIKDEASPLVSVAKDWRQLLFPDADDEKFADAYAQTVTFALLLARTEGTDPLTLEGAQKELYSAHSLLSRALQVLTDESIKDEISASLNLLLRVIGAIAPEALEDVDQDPWLYFYEVFLSVYDPELRKDAGAYYTPTQIVQAQVRLVYDLLVNRLDKEDGFADPGVVTLDPALGTGTYVLGVIKHAIECIRKKEGRGAVKARGKALAGNLYGFENMVGPYAVAELRISRALADHGIGLPEKGLGIFLTDTLESPHAVPMQSHLYLEAIALQHKRALKVKAEIPVIVCLGNPPYDRHDAVDKASKTKPGGWVRWGDKGTKETEKASIFRKFVEPAIAAGHGGDIKNLYNLYAYFWCWALWKVFDHETTAAGPGIVSFISASSYLDGDSFSGMREYMRRVCDEIWIIDLEGEGRGTRKSENVFNIQTPVAIALATRYGKLKKAKPAKVHYAVIDGTRDEKLGALEKLASFEDLAWEDCPGDWQATFRPAGKGKYFKWPLLTDLLPWQHSGAQAKRTWPIAPDKETLEHRWKGLLRAADRAVAFRECRDRKIESVSRVNITPDADVRPISRLASNTAMPVVRRYSYRSFDRQYILADARLITYPRPDLWKAHGKRQVYIATLVSHPLGSGPALTACCEIPDLNYFRGSHAGKIIPLYRDSKNEVANVSDALPNLLTETYGFIVPPEDFFAYVYGVLAHPGFTEKFEKELGTRDVRVPITKDAELFATARDIGRKLLWLHTYGERFIPRGARHGALRGNARNTKEVSDSPEKYPDTYGYDEASGVLRVGDGEFRPVSKDVWGFEVSGHRVVKSWLDYRKKAGHGRTSSPLDGIRPDRWWHEFTTELLELLGVLEKTLEEYPKQQKLLARIVKGPIFKTEELPDFPDWMRNPPSKVTSDTRKAPGHVTGDIFDEDDNEQED